MAQALTHTPAKRAALARQYIQEFSAPLAALTKEEIREGLLGLESGRIKRDRRRVAVGQVLIRNLDDHVIESLRLKAELKGHSLEQELREVLKQAAGPTVEERLAMIDRVRAMQKKPSKVRSEDVVRKLRDERIRKLTGRRA